MDGQNNEQRENRSASILLKVQAPFQTYDLRMPILSTHFLHYPSLPNLLRLITEMKSSLPRVWKALCYRYHDRSRDVVFVWHHRRCAGCRDHSLFGCCRTFHLRCFVVVDLWGTRYAGLCDLYETVTCVHVPVTVHRSGQCRISYV